jgi:hypothetical protein
VQCTYNSRKNFDNRHNNMRNPILTFYRNILHHFLHTFILCVHALCASFFSLQQDKSFTTGIKQFAVGHSPTAKAEKHMANQCRRQTHGVSSGKFVTGKFVNWPTANKMAHVKRYAVWQSTANYCSGSHVANSNLFIYRPTANLPAANKKNVLLPVTPVTKARWPATAEVELDGRRAENLEGKQRHARGSRECRDGAAAARQQGGRGGAEVAAGVGGGRRGAEVAAAAAARRPRWLSVREGAVAVRRWLPARR